MGGELFLVTGANKGIGYFITRGLLKRGARVILACRCEARAVEAIGKLEKELKGSVPNVRELADFIPVDLESPKSLTDAAAIFAALYPNRKLDALINNAGFAFNVDATEPVVVQAAKTVGINYTNTVALTEAFLPHVRNGGRVVFVGSRAGLLGQLSPALQAQFLDEALTTDGLRGLLETYLQATRDGTHIEKGFPGTTYGMSKIGINTYARVLARRPDVVARAITSNTCCPGWCVTDMTGGEGNKTAEEGADTPTWLATEEALATVTGRFFGERKELDWTKAGW